MERQPNVLIIICDDLAYGDLGCHGNPAISTPHLDRLYGESVRLRRHCSGPLCSPARAGLMTGRYHYRTGVVDTYLGRSMMYPDEVTIAEVLVDVGYRTGIFGKWHLGDNYPLRAMDQGFQEALVHNGGGIGQPGDAEGSRYQDPTLFHNGKQEKHTGYCADVFTDALVEWIGQEPGAPFFGYLAFNTPHSPFQIADERVEPYRRAGLPDVTAKLYAMVTNIDENVGKVLSALERFGLAEDTMLLFTSDHGPCPSSRPPDRPARGALVDQFRYNAGLRGYKGNLYEGGVRVPCFVRLPGRFPAGYDVDRITSPIDLLPTIVSLCGADAPANLDGVDLLPLLGGERTHWPDRTLFMQWHRGDVPERWRNCAVIRQRYKLIDGKELYDVEADPAEREEIAASHPRLVDEMRAEYEAWFDDVSSTRGYEPPRIVLGTPHENPSVLTRQDWRGPEREGWSDDDIGYWEVEVAEAAPYDVTLRFPTIESEGEAILRFEGTERAIALRAGDRRCVLENVPLAAGAGRLHAWIRDGERRKGVRYVDVSRRSRHAG